MELLVPIVLNTDLVSPDSNEHNKEVTSAMVIEVFEDMM